MLFINRHESRRDGTSRTDTANALYSRCMKHTHVSVRVHCIFTTKNRYGGIPESLQPRLWSFIAGIGRNLGIQTIATGGTADHVHMLFALPTTMSIATAIQKIKANSSRWMHQVTGRCFAWQEGYAAFSVGLSQTAATAAYIRRQREHHRKRSVADELSAVIRKLSFQCAVPAGLMPVDEEHPSLT